jgi:ParB family chromosome partitioning protein
MQAVVNQEELKLVALDKIRVNPYQPRTQFSDIELQELSDSIKTVGIIHPPTVRVTEVEGVYEIISGERRYRASILAGLKEIPVVVRQTQDAISAQAALIENIQRVDLNPLEIAKAFKSLMQEFNLNQEQLAQRVGKKRSTVSNYLRLLNLPQKIQDALIKNLVSMGHAKAILSVESIDKQIYLYDLILRDNLSVRATEEKAQAISSKAKKNKPLTYSTRDFYLEQLAEKIQYKLGTKVSIQGKGRKGRITIDYFNLDDLDRFLKFLNIDGL